MPQHDSKNCRLCAVLRHPARRADTAELRKHLAEHPMPAQRTGTPQ